MNDYVLVAVPEQGAELVLGMRWHTILGSQLAVRARKKAREVRASHYAHAGDRSEAVGTVRFARPDRRARGVVRYCAALVFAAGHARGRVALCCPLPDGRVWLVAVHDGKVLTQSDRVFDSLADAHQALHTLVERHGEMLTVHGAGLDDQAEPFELSQLIPELKSTLALRASGFTVPGVPRPVWVATAGVVLAFGGRAAWDHLRSGAPLPAAPAITPAGLEQAWRDHLAGFASRMPVHDQAALQALSVALRQMPASVGGWGLRGAVCEPLQAGGWLCQASYMRDSRIATNASFLAKRPAAWQESWQPLEGVTASFEVDAPHHTLDLATLAPLAQQDEQVVSALQQALPAFVRIALAPPSEVRIPAPLDQAGIALQAPAGTPEIRERAIALEGPMRSLALLPAAMHGHVAWKRVELRRDDTASAGLNQSRLMAIAQGVLYAKK